jgi:hypothetical protein
MHPKAVAAGVIAIAAAIVATAEIGVSAEITAIDRNAMHRVRRRPQRRLHRQMPITFGTPTSRAIRRPTARNLRLRSTPPRMTQVAVTAQHVSRNG